MALLGSNSQTIGSDWEPWGLWSDCSVTCGSGEMVRTRACGSGTPSNCQGDSTQQEICTKAKCPNAGDEWGTWEQWSTCSKDCNGGKRKRERQCTDGNGGKGKKCTGDDKKEEKCNQQDCVKVDGEWEAWGQWSDCSKICNKGKRKRERTCFKTKGSKKNDCSGSKDEEEYCNEQKCPHPDGTWEDWGTWSACSKSCGKGKRERTRKCFSSVPGNGYGLCKPGKPDEEEYCNDTPCPKSVDEWGTWEQWSTCSKDCNGGKRKRERQCTDGNGGKGKKCTGDDKEEEKCNQQDCVKVDGEWEAWGQWSDCSKICNKGKRKRERTCFKTKGSKKKDCSGSKDEEEYCNEQKCPHPDGTWEDWGTWSACSKSCGKGKRERTRKCFSSVPGNGYGLCKPGKPDEEEYCNDTPCPKAVDEWGTWEQWSTCSKDCNGGKRKRERQCTDGNGGKGKKCTGDDKEEEKCNQQDCVKVDGEWEAWGQWSDCSKICNKGKRKRERTCFKTKGSKKKDCSGSKDEEEYCNEQKCPHPDGTWEDWGTWSACSKSCGKGKRERTRKCFSSVPGNGYGLCKPGKPDEEEYCNDTPCPKAVDEWGTWEQWSTCSKDCNGGKRKRERQCTDGNGGKGKKCTGDDKEEEKCNQQDCVKVDGEWEAWGQWSDCSKICNKGKRKRERTCFKTKGSKKNDCSGSKDEEEYCNEQKCPHPDGTWEDWGTWSACSKSCGKGKRERTRKCFSSVPGNGYGLCKPGKPDEEEYCNDTPCPKAVDEWGTWEQWSTCSKDCNGGKRKRERQCTDGNGGKGKKCTGDDKEEEKCNQQDCVKVDGEWEAWGQWSDCSKICNKGKRKRERTCFKTKGSKKNDCSGSKDEEEYCNEQKCPHPDGTWEDWGTWSACSKSCGKGKRERTRKCFSSVPGNGYGLCKPGKPDEEEYCNDTPCPKDEWGTWEQWSSCSKDCNGGKRKRERQCTDGNGGKGKKCTGDDKEEEKCNQQDCVKVDGEWEAWGQWSDCSKICNKGKRKRERTCFKTKGSKKNDCSGSKDEEEYCNEQKCPHPDGTWEDWGTWSACSKSCGKGKRERTRKCFSSVPGNGYGLCKPGKPDEEEYCNDTPCPKAVDEWGTWEQWSTCSKDCNGGKRKRERQCTDGNGGKGKKCTGDDKEEEKCNQQDCVKVDGEWEAWGQWSDCSKICNKGKRKRERTCFKTKGSKKNDCSGSKDEEEYCNEQKCPHPDGTWEDWGTWSACSKSCGKGKRERTRKCFSSVPGNGYGLCKPGKPDEEEYCNDTPCPKDEWGTWEQWSSCSKDCNGGKRKRERQCTDGNGGKGKKCTGDDKEEEKCNQQDCVKVDGEWEAWGQWSDCSKICNKGKRKRERTCFKTKGSKKNDCSGSKDEEEYCNEQKCPHPDGTWEDWGTWSACSKSCGKGKRERTRKCFSSVPGNGYGLCKPGKPDEEEYCNDTPCPKAVDEWGTWEQWSTCSKDCNGGKRKRERQCTDGNGGKGKKCTGDDKEEEKCNQQDCVKVDGEWEAWGQWSDCSKICNKGKRKRERTCFKTKGSKKNDCSGSKDEEEYCNEQKCPHPDGTWEDWGTWSACSKSCGKGKRERTRKCFSSVPGNGYGLCKPGKPDEEEYCNDTPCPKDEWGIWEQWSTCSKDCNGGKRKRERQCTDGNGGKGKKCTGDDKEEEKCNQQDCVKVDGEWETWGQWSDCSKICNKGKRKRERTCFKTKGSKKNDCSGSKDEEEYCNEQKCPHPDGTWEDWGTWSACSKSCGKGKRERTRKCFSSVPGNGYGLCKPGKPDEEEYCNDTPCPKAPINGGFSAWSTWTSCSKTCGSGKMTRTRLCNNPAPSNGGAACSGDQSEENICNTQACPVAINGGFSDWSTWGACSKTCGSGKKTRTRSCTNPAPSNGGAACSGDRSQEDTCNTQTCPVAINGGFSDWSTWGACSKTCGSGKKTRTRSCTNPVPSNGGSACSGDSSQEDTCNTQACPVAINGGFSDWSTWGACSKTCGSGKKTRTRSCTNPAPSNGGAACSGDRSQEDNCNTQACPVAINGGFSDWSTWGACSKTCGSGKKTRTRSCTNPAPSNGGSACSGDSSQEDTCNTQACPVAINGGFSDWSTWGTCSKTCGSGKKTRTRSCTNPVPSNGGSACSGDSSQEDTCNTQACPVAINGGFSDWSTWGACSKTCGSGKKSRTRSCTNPAPSNGGAACSGDSSQEDICNTQACPGPVNGGYSNWSAWSSCTKPCGSGKMTRKRTCDNPAPSNGGAPCSGDDTQESDCNTQKCKQDNTWEDWEAWSSCSKTCGGGRRSRTRNCYTSTPGLALGRCKGKKEEKETCNAQACPVVDGAWEDWSAWSKCSKTCGGGKQLRSRQCNNPRPSNGGKKCIGSTLEFQQCGNRTCPAKGTAVGTHTHRCPQGWYQCYSGTISCILEEFLCDCQNDCDDGSDEDTILASCDSEAKLMCFSAATDIHPQYLTVTVLMVSLALLFRCFR